MKIILNVINSVFVFVLYLILVFCGAVATIPISYLIQSVLINSAIKNLPYLITGIEIFISFLIITYSVKRLKHVKRIYLFTDFNALGQDAINSYLTAFIIGFACGLFYLLPANFIY
jgi:hypothetical protein